MRHFILLFILLGHGNEEKSHDFLKLIDRFDFWFNIVAP